MFSGDIFSEPVVVEKVRRSPRKRKTELDEVLSEGTEQLWRPKGDPLLTGDEPVVIHSEPSAFRSVLRRICSSLLDSFTSLRLAASSLAVS
mgnify:CR=1 FL=1